jgi:transposase
MSNSLTSYPSDVSDEEWAFVAPYLTLMREDAPQRDHTLRAVFNALRWMVRAGAPWRLLPHDFPPWPAVYQQTRRWLAAGCFEAVVHDLRAVLRLAAGRAPDPSAVIFDSRTVQSSPESGARAGYDGYKRRKGSKVHAAVDTLGHLLTAHVTPANEQDRAQVAELAGQVQAVTDGHVELALTRAILASGQPRRPRTRASAWRWSSCQEPAKASFFYRVDGLWNGSSPGLPGSVASPGTMKDCRKPWKDCTSSLSPASCSPEAAVSSHSSLQALGLVPVFHGVEPVESTDRQGVEPERR